jgi:hypothetical protein
VFAPLDGAPGPLPQAFNRETRELMLRRTRVAIGLGASIHAAFIVADPFRVVPGEASHAVAFRAAGIVASIALLAVTRMPGALAHSHRLGAAALAILMATTASIMPLLGGVADPDYAIQGTGMALCILGGGLLLPFDGSGMFGLGMLALALHLGFTLDFPLDQNLPIVLATLAAIPVATVGARELTRSRLAEFEGRRAKEDLFRSRTKTALARGFG